MAESDPKKVRMLRTGAPSGAASTPRRIRWSSLRGSSARMAVSPATGRRGRGRPARSRSTATRFRPISRPSSCRSSNRPSRRAALRLAPARVVPQPRAGAAAGRTMPTTSCAPSRRSSASSSGGRKRVAQCPAEPVRAEPSFEDERPSRADSAPQLPRRSSRREASLRRAARKLLARRPRLRLRREFLRCARWRHEAPPARAVEARVPSRVASRRRRAARERVAEPRAQENAPVRRQGRPAGDGAGRSRRCRGGGQARRAAGAPALCGRGGERVERDQRR